MAEVREYKKETAAGEGKKPRKATSAKAAAPKEKSAPKVSQRPQKAQDGAVGGFAVIETGGKQYRVSVGDTIKVEKVKGDLKNGDPIIFDKVLLVDNGTDSTDVGTPYISGAQVTATLLEVGRYPKVIVMKYKQKSRYLKKNGHRQPYFKVKIEKIS